MDKADDVRANMYPNATIEKKKIIFFFFFLLQFHIKSNLWYVPRLPD